LGTIAEAPVDKARGLDLTGQIFAIAGLALPIAAGIEAGRSGVTPIVVGGLVLGAIAAGAFVLVEWRATSPLMPLQLFRDRTFSTALAVGLLINLTFYGLIFVLSLYFQRELGYGPATTGLAFMPMTAVVIASNVAGGWLAGEYGSRWPMAAGAGVGALGYALLGLTIAPQAAYALLLPGMALIPIGIGLAVPAMTSATLSAVERKQSGIASGMLNTVRQAGGAAGVAVFGALIGGHGGDTVAGVRWALAISTALLAVAALLSAAGIRQR
jgi:DHA2 family methylenomycin A resistance protein-like MFS transporter